MRLFIILVFLTCANADVYIHNPRGNNNRCDRRTNDRRNANRLFDSQNNAAGGYAIPCNRPESATTPEEINCYQMNYYMDTVIPIRWTSQHNCGENNDCQFILQYSCEGQLGNSVRDGHPQNSNGDTCTTIIPEQMDEDIVNPNKYGKHEDFPSYQRCKQRYRNNRLFTADQRLRGRSAVYTRQNPNGNRYGFECPEERDYYPYWAESEWRDIAVLTSDTSRCEYYYNHSRCNTIKHDCVGLNLQNNNLEYPHDKDTCESQGGHWLTYQPFEYCNMTCLQAPQAPINRLGSGSFDDKHNGFYWRLPTFENNMTNCVLRLRYNISTKETPWEFTIDNNTQLENNPVINTSTNIPVRLAINTAQYGRVFEDRTWTFNIIKRPTELLDKTIHNINVQGKRGNIAQVRNCIEYDFVPNTLNITEEDYIHFQWVGSDFNPNGNDGEGRAGTDRSNLIEIESHKHNIPYDEMFFDYNVSYTLASLNQPIDNSNVCYTFDELYTLNKRNDQQSLKNCALLNQAEPYFNMKPIKVPKNGTYKLMSSRNNNFSNRGQKLTLLIKSIKEAFNNIQTGQSNNGSGNNNVVIIPVVIICCFVLFIICYVTIKYIRDKGGVKKVKLNIQRNFSSDI